MPLYSMYEFLLQEAEMKVHKLGYKLKDGVRVAMDYHGIVGRPDVWEEFGDDFYQKRLGVCMAIVKPINEAPNWDWNKMKHAKP
jgi:hypothetical protein